jgi:CheY-like chemotaxis protein
MGPTRVLIADDQAVIRAGLRMILEHEVDLTVVGEAADGVDVLVPADLLQVRTDGRIAPWFSALLSADRSLPDLVDGWTVHPYPSPRSAPPDAHGDPRFGFGRVEETRRLAAAAGVERPIERPVEEAAPTLSAAFRAQS